MYKCLSYVVCYLLCVCCIRVDVVWCLVLYLTIYDLPHFLFRAMIGKLPPTTSAAAGHGRAGSSGGNQPSGNQQNSSPSSSGGGISFSGGSSIGGSGGGTMGGGTGGGGMNPGRDGRGNYGPSSPPTGSLPPFYESLKGNVEILINHRHDEQMTTFD